MESIIFDNLPLLLLYIGIIILGIFIAFFKRAKFYLSLVSIILIGVYIIISFIYEITLMELITSLLIYIILISLFLLIAKRVYK